jgi:hypothetical protein
MSAVEIILRLAAVCLLTSYLVFKHRQRLRNLSPMEDPVKWTGKTIDVTKLIPTVDRVRNDYIAAQFQRRESLSYRRNLIALAGRAIRQLAFFEEGTVKMIRTKTPRNYALAANGAAHLTPLDISLT